MEHDLTSLKGELFMVVPIRRDLCLHYQLQCTRKGLAAHN